MSQALHTASTGINAGQQQINVIANNVANINTVAFKSANMTFETLYSNTLSYGSAATKEGGGTNPKQIGLGVQIGGISRNFDSGTFVATGRSLDLMISGSGYFVVQDAEGQQYFTRDGCFTTDYEGNLVTQSGMKVVGAKSPYTNTSSSDTVKIPTNLKVTVSNTANVEDKYIYELNEANITSGSFDVAVLGADGQTVGTVTLTIDDTHQTVGDMVADFNASIAAYNAAHQGAEIDLNVTVANGSISFNTGADNDLKFTADDTNFLAEVGISDSNYTSNPINQSVVIQDLLAYDDPDGLSLQTVTVDENGIIAATYNDGSILTTTIDQNGAAVWKYTTPEGVVITGGDVTTRGSISADSNFIIELANMVNQEGLVSINNNLWEWGPDVGEIYYGMAGEMAFGSIESGGYEGSNVDIATELSNMITAQRMIQMNSRVFSTASSVMETLAYLGQ